MKSLFVLFIALIISACVTVEDDNNANNTANNANNANNVNNVNNVNNANNLNNQNNANNVAMDCETRCSDAAQACGAPAAQGGIFCQEEICSKNPSETSMTCFEETSCDVLMGFFTDPEGTLCGLDFSTNQNNQNNENNDVCIEQNDTGCNPQNNPSNCCDDRAACFGNGNQAGETICCAPIGNGCDTDSDCCNDDNPNAPAVCVDNTCEFSI